MGRGAWWAKVHKVAKSQTRLSNFTFTFTFHACQAPLPTEFSRQEYLSGFPIPASRVLLDSGIGPVTLVSPALEDKFYITSATWEVNVIKSIHHQ